MAVNPEQLIQRLGRRYFSVLLVVSCLLILDQAVLQPLLIRLNLSAPVINLAGRQRMLSQRLTKTALIVTRTSGPLPDSIEDLNSSLREWTRVHEGLQHGNETLELPGTDSSRIRAAFTRLNPHFEAIRSNLQSIISDPGNSTAAVSQLLIHEQTYLRIMDEIVTLLESEAQSQVQQLRWLGLALTATTLALLSGLAILVLRPATHLIRIQVHQLAESESELRHAHEELELRVIERTSELSQANAALAREAEERQLAEQRSRQLQSDLAHAARVTSLGQLATGLAHELNQPLGAITNFTETLKILAERPSPPIADLTTISQRIRDAALRAGRIVSQMRDFVRPRTRERNCESLTQLIREVLTFCEPEIRSHQTQLRVDLPEDDPQNVLINSIQVQQVLVNLIQNALQAMSQQDVTCRVLTVSASRVNDQFIVKVEDQGPGFPPEFRFSQFKPFQTTKEGGMGIGLSISESLIASHGGTLWAKSLNPRGARVCFTLPSVELLPHVSSSSPDRLYR